MLCSSSSSDLFCPSHPLFFPPPTPIPPPFAWFRFLCPDPAAPAENTCGVSFLLPSPASSLLAFVFLGWGCQGGTGGHRGCSLTLLEGEDSGAVVCGVEISPEAKCAINLAQGIPRARARAGHRSGAEGPRSTRHITLIPLLFPFPHRFPWLAGGDRSCCSGAVGSVCSGGGGVHMHIYT